MVQVGKYREMTSLTTSGFKKTTKMSFFERVSGGNPFGTQVGQLIGKFHTSINILQMPFYMMQQLSPLNSHVRRHGRGFTLPVEKLQVQQRSRIGSRSRFWI